jgi:hypothetical protein
MQTRFPGRKKVRPPTKHSQTIAPDAKIAVVVSIDKDINYPTNKKGDQLWHI